MNIRLQPRASRDEIVGAQGTRLKIRITAPPVEGKANAHLVRFLAKAFGVSRSQVLLVSGEASREKRVRVEQPKKIPNPIADLL
ncbi:MAG: DUF167 family protein [Gammaproteobacteria bacterium]